MVALLAVSDFSTLRTTTSFDLSTIILLDELPDLLDNIRFISVHYTTIYHDFFFGH
ncbi:hypothetical protein K503DRAFT_770695 [Rhizopogon vinicolor AM-OR11-026]|uniref:Uncharacterized protein n=1 Tax=Rhizopogon vinicolor AM-OR11-026 TaxID=1314800 RepID=A0A1B7N074_9AGAM|nr:hypothetical protein K503DRAFT_770695 [Rhizopogon vinicolor AM-OR11-026]